MARIITCIFLSIILVICSVIATNRGLASLYAYPGKSSLTLWREGKLPQLRHDWQKVRGTLEKALSYDGQNPDLLHDLGESYDAEVAYYAVGNKAAAANRDSARQNYNKALAGRPTWPHDWIALALVKYRLGEIDDEFYRALHLAVEQGPWEPGVQFVVADIGMHHWDRSDQAIRALVTGIIQRAVNNADSARGMLDLMKRYDMPELVCGGAATTELVLKYCEQNRRR